MEHIPDRFIIKIISLGLVYREQNEQEPIRMEQDNEYRDAIVGGEITFTYHLSDEGNLINKFYVDLFPEHKEDIMKI
ncbi:hypothetical protein [Aquimarina macrocephali]|uniref:hypothetical protein n=1 Tax=Aquimarina macrocephali TaxID=666563 RepID=UPI000686906F|nr:hypothetical protein [Aquimarina macrocephali]